MTDKVSEVGSIVVACHNYVALIREVAGGTDLSSLNSFIDAGVKFQTTTEIAASNTFVSIGRSVNALVQSCVDSDSCLAPLEKETLELAADWLDQLAGLYREGLPEPKALVKELLYTFELVGRSHGANSLSDLLVHKEGGAESMDMFAQDPDFESDSYHSPVQDDPFDEDPGFGMEFDLLQRTLTLAGGENIVTNDIFTDDDHFDAESCDGDGRVVDLPFDVFADDPQSEDE